MPQPIPIRPAEVVAPRTSARRAFGGEVDDAELVRRAQAGEEWATEALFRRHVEGITRLCTRLVGRRADADDAVQDTFAEALRDLPKLREPEAFRGWLQRVAVNRSKKVYRKRRLLRTLGLDRGIDDATLTQLASEALGTEALTELTLIDAALRRLPTEQRIAWMLRYVQDETLESVAELMQCSLATAKRRVAAAQSALDVHLRRGE